MYILLLRAQSSFHMNCRFNFHPSELVTPENLAKWVVKSFVLCSESWWRLTAPH